MSAPREPTVSVVVPAYRQAALVGACLDSIAAQTYRGPVEVVVVDDGCPEGTGEVAATHALRPRVVRQSNAGVAAARNRGVAETTGELVAFLDADDRWRPDKLARQVARHVWLDRPGLSFTRYRRVLVDGGEVADALHPSERQPVTPRALVRRNFIGCSTVVVARACLTRVGGFPSSDALRRAGQDYALWLRVAAYFPLVYLPEVLTEYTVHASNRVGTDAVKHFEGWVSAIRSFEEWDPERFHGIAGLSRRGLTHLRARNLLSDAARAGQLGRAFAAYRSALAG